MSTSSSAASAESENRLAVRKCATDKEVSAAWLQRRGDAADFEAVRKRRFMVTKPGATTSPTTPRDEGDDTLIVLKRLGLQDYD